MIGITNGVLWMAEILAVASVKRVVAGERNVERHAFGQEALNEVQGRQLGERLSDDLHRVEDQTFPLIDRAMRRPASAPSLNRNITRRRRGGGGGGHDLQRNHL